VLRVELQISELCVEDPPGDAISVVEHDDVGRQPLGTRCVAQI
jgi:hypothetical protein